MTLVWPNYVKKSSVIIPGVLFPLESEQGRAHLKDFDANNLPEVVDLPHIREAALDYYDNYWSSFWERLKKKYSAE